MKKEDLNKAYWSCSYIESWKLDLLLEQQILDSLFHSKTSIPHFAL